MAVFVVVKRYQITGLDRPLGLQEVEVPIISRQMCQLYAPAAFTPRRYPGYSFSLEVESIPGPWHCRKD
jgi:hypothetical protein